MKKIKVRVVSNYADSERLHSEILRQFTTHKKPKIFDFTTGDNYDMLFICNYWEDTPRVSQENIFVLAQEPSWSQNFRDYSFSCAEFISPTMGKLPMMFNWTGLDFKEAVNGGFEKNKKCSFIIAKHDGEDQSKDYTLYAWRERLVDTILSSDLDIDIYGKGWDIIDSRYKGELEEKKYGLIDYHASICIENCNQEFYVSEKFWDAILCESFPITYKMIGENMDIDNLRRFIDMVALEDNSTLLKKHKMKYLVDLNIYSYICKKVNEFKRK